MAKSKDVVIGYFAVHPPIDVLCDGDACIVAGSQSALNKYIKSIHRGGVEFQKRKINFSEILDGLSRGGAYAFDEVSYKVFYPLANKNGYELKNELFTESGAGHHFVVIRKSGT